MTTHQEWTTLRPSILGDPDLRPLFQQCGHVLEQVSAATDLATTRADMVAGIGRTTSERALELRVLVSVLFDLRAMGWSFRVMAGAVQISPPNGSAMTAEELKAFVREGHLIERDAQLAQRPTRAFIESMERRRPTRNGWHSIFSLMRDGRSLAAELERARAEAPGPARNAALTKLVRPYVQLVRRGERCRFTNLDLADVWRYFRHTWTTVYQSTPGRNLSFLVRDAGAPNHPVIGIGAIGSSIVQLRARDAWIGWTGEEFLKRIGAESGGQWARWLDREFRDLLDEVYHADLITEGVVRPEEIECPTEQAIDRLRAFAAEARQLHRLYPQREEHKRNRGDAPAECEARAHTHLFRFKRAKALADLLCIRQDLTESGFTRPVSAQLRRVITAAKGQRAILSVLRRAKAKRVGVNMMDITVCGAVAPYNALLGGKLVSLMMASSDVSRAYTATYANATSVIASGMAARPVNRSPNLVLLGTTSLYATSPSQYNRLRVPAALISGRAGSEIRYEQLGRTSGFGSYQFSEETTELMEILLARQQRGREVNSIFGEGVNPKLRKVRAALDAVGLPAELLLRHGQSRLVYGIPLAENFRDVLIGTGTSPRYILPQGRSTAPAIGRFWIQRWLSRRIDQSGIIETVARNTLAYPVEHGARVPILQTQDDVLGVPFEVP
jgi:hypothetical protein